MEKNIHTPWPLRLGYSVKHAKVIKKTSLESFLKQSFDTMVYVETPEFIQSSPKSYKEFQFICRKIKSSKPEVLKERVNKELNGCRFKSVVGC